MLSLAFGHVVKHSMPIKLYAQSQKRCKKGSMHAMSNEPRITYPKATKYVISYRALLLDMLQIRPASGIYQACCKPPQLLE